MLSRFPPILLVICLLGLSACTSHATRSSGGIKAGSRAQVMQKLRAAEPCCTQFSQFDFKHKLPAEPRRFEVDPGLPVANFNGTNSYFLTFKLPEKHDLPYRVLLKSEVIGRWLHSSYLFAPSVVVLDASYHPLQNTDVKQCEYIGWSSSTTGALGSIPIDSPRARYLVVYTSGKQLSSNTYWEQSPTAYSAVSPVKMAASGSFSIPHGPDGAIYVGVMTHRYAKAVSEAICADRSNAPKQGLLPTLRSLIMPSSGHDKP